MDYFKLISFLRLDENNPLIKSIKEEYPKDINSIANLINKNPDKPIKELLTAIRIQKKIAGKISDNERYLFTEKSGQQSTSTIVSEYHKEKFCDYKRIADLCCGSGMDLIKIAEGKEKVWAVDLDEVTLETARYNCQQDKLSNIEFCKMKAEDFIENVEAAFIDPDRRVSNKRQIRVEDYSPNLNDIIRLQQRIPDMICKFSPAINYKAIHLDIPFSWEFISERGELKEALLCLGGLASRHYGRAAVAADKNLIITSDMTESKAISEIGEYLFEPDPAVIRAGLITQLAHKLGLTRIDPDLALLSGNDRVDSDWVNQYKVLDVQKYNFKGFKKYLSENKIGKLVIKTRGFPESVENFRKKLKLKGSFSALIFILRFRDYHIFVRAEEAN